MKNNQAVELIGSFVVVSVIVCLFLSSIAFAKEGPDVLPDDPLYPAKRHMETAALASGSDPLVKANLHTKHAKERLAEARATVSKGKPEFVEGLMGDYESSITEATKNIERAANQGRDVSEALKAVERATKKHNEVLTGLLDKVPEQAKPAIVHAIKVSKRGRNRALDALNKVQRGELPIGRPEGIGGPGKANRPRGEDELREGIGKSKGIVKPKGLGRFGGIEGPGKYGKPKGIGGPGKANRSHGGGGPRSRGR